MLTIEKNELILDQMKYAICKIGDSNGTGFFCKIPINNKDHIIGLITAFHVFNKICSNFAKISLNNGTNIYEINLKKD